MLSDKYYIIFLQSRITLFQKVLALLNNYWKDTLLCNNKVKVLENIMGACFPKKRSRKQKREMIMTLAERS